MTLDLPTPPLPDEISSGRGLRAGLGERDLAAFGVTVGRRLPGGGRGIAVQGAAQRLALVVGHHGEVELHAGHAVERLDGTGDAVLDLVAQRTSGDREGDEDVGGSAVVELGAPEHPEVDDRAVQLGILDRSKGCYESVVHLIAHRDHSGGDRPGFALRA